MPRVAIREFTTANPVYAGCTAEFWTVSAGAKTTIHATLYSGPTGSSRLANPITLDSRGMGGPIYIEEPVICTVGGLTVASHDTGIIAPGPTFQVDQSTGKLQYSYDGASWSDTGDYVFKHRGSWLTATGYYRNDTVLESGNLYLCVTAHTSGTFATDLAAGKWALAVNGFLALSGGTLSGDLNLGAGVNVVFEGTTADAFETTLSGGEPTADRTVTLPNDSGTVALDKNTLNVGKHSIWIPAQAMIAYPTYGAASSTIEATSGVVLGSKDFDDTTDESVGFAVAMPKSWNEGTLTASFYWSVASGSGNVVWGLEAVAISDDDPLAGSAGTAQTVTDGVTATNDLMRSAETSAITVGRTPAANDLVVLRAYRDANNGSDTLTGDARLHGVMLFYTLDASTDA